MAPSPKCRFTADVPEGSAGSGEADRVTRPPACRAGRLLFGACSTTYLQVQRQHETGQHDHHRQSLLRNLDHAVRRAAVFAASSPSISCRPTSAPSPSTRPRSPRSPARPSRRPSTTPSSRWRTPAAPCSASTTCSASSVGTDSNDTLLAIERDISPRTAAHWNKVRMNDGLFARHRRALSASATASASPPSRSACWSATTPSTAARARRSTPDKKKRLAAIVERLAALGTAFSQNVLADEQSYTMELDGEADLAGLPDFVREAAAAAADRARHDRQARHHPAALQRRAVPAILVAARSSREGVPRLDRARRQRRQDRQQGDHRRDHCAARSSAPSCSAIRPSRNTGSTTPWPRRRRRCAGLLEKVWKPARKAALADRDALQELIAEEGGNFKLAAWDWRYYAEKLRARRCDFEESEVKPYFQLDRVIEAAFYGAQKLFGLTFHPVEVPVWHPDVRAWEVRGAGRRPRRHLLRRLFRAPEQARRRLDGHLARPGEARRQRPPDRAQRDELQQGRPDAAVVRGRPHPVPRDGPRAAWPAVQRHLSDRLLHQRADRLGRAAVAALRALVRAAGGAAQVRPPLQDRRADPRGAGRRS